MMMSIIINVNRFDFDQHLIERAMLCSPGPQSVRQASLAPLLKFAAIISKKTFHR
jgi:hypothetical protein